MKVAILECDFVLDKFEEEFGQYSTMIKNMLAALDSRMTFDVFDCQQSEYPLDINGYDFYITTGSKADAYGDEPWIKGFIAFIRQLDAAGKKLIGICFGHQAIAIARHGHVERSSKGWGVGIAKHRMVRLPNWMGEQRKELNLLISHRDQVITLPAEALVIAESDFCPNFVVQWNDHFLSVQGHPEWKKGYSSVLIKERSAIIPKDRAEAGLSTLSGEPDNRLFAQWIIDFAKFESSHSIS